MTDLLAQLSCEDAVAGADEISLESVSDGFVQQDAAAAGCHYDRHLATLDLRGGEKEIGAPDGFANDLVDEGVREELRTHLKHTRGIAHLCLAVPLHNDVHRKRGARTEVVEGRTIAGHELNLLHPLRDVCLDLDDGIVKRLGSLLDLQEKLTDLERRKRSSACFADVPLGHKSSVLSSFGGDGGGCWGEAFCCLHQGFLTQVHRIGIARLSALDRTNAGAVETNLLGLTYRTILQYHAADLCIL